jgi:23S rRNA C2498 (ribose-2'-O)-methylase RlmM
MQTTDIIHEILQLPVNKRFYVVEETLKSIKKEEMNHQMELAAAVLYDDYANDENLTVFTGLDLEHFYEAK